MKKDSWDSEFRKKRFYDNQRRKAEKKFNQQMDGAPLFPRVLQSDYVVNPKSIAIMLDLDGTSDWCDKSTAEIFIKQVDTLRKQFGGQKAYICISTHAHGFEPIKRVFDEMAPFLNDDIILSNSFYYGGMYIYSTNENYNMGVMFNMNKVQTFNDRYLESEHLNIGWFALIDDSIAEYVYKQYKETKPMVALKPGCNSISKYKNFMYRETCTDNFYGVVELLDEYIKDIKGMDYYDILDKQEQMMSHLSSFELRELVRNRQFSSLSRYLESGLADNDDYKSVFSWMIMENDIEPFDMRYEAYIERILGILSENGAFTETVEEAKSLVLDLEEME